MYRQDSVVTYGVISMHSLQWFILIKYSLKIFAYDECSLE